MPVAVWVLVLLDRVVARSTAGRDADPWSRYQPGRTGTDFIIKLVLVASAPVYARMKTESSREA